VFDSARGNEGISAYVISGIRYEKGEEKREVNKKGKKTKDKEEFKLKGSNKRKKVAKIMPYRYRGREKKYFRRDRG
jgi:hypothetical protein